jgi:molybdopterin/thiamine biosynthesis adenylyltransferase
MNDQQLLRYSRHILLDEIGIEGQQRLTSAKALIVGAGGLGSPAALYLAASGIGQITIADDDIVDLTNLQRQILHTSNRVGQSKVGSARIALSEINPDIDIVALDERVSGERLNLLVSESTVVLDCSDNFTTRHAINRACVKNNVPLISGAAIRFDGQVSVFDSRNPDSPCYACLFPEDAATEEASCASLGVFAPLVGIIGAMQAAEALKLACDVGTSLVGKLLLFNARDATWSSMTIARDDQCKVCGSALSPLAKSYLSV